MARGTIKLDKPLLSENEWFYHACEALVWIEETDMDWPVWLVRETKRLGAAKIQRWLSGDAVNFGDYHAGLALAEYCGVT